MFYQRAYAKGMTLLALHDLKAIENDERVVLAPVCTGEEMVLGGVDERSWYPCITQRMTWTEPSRAR